MYQNVDGDVAVLLNMWRTIHSNEYNCSVRVEMMKTKTNAVFVLSNINRSRIKWPGVCIRAAFSYLHVLVNRPYIEKERRVEWRVSASSQLHKRFSVQRVRSHF